MFALMIINKIILIANLIRSTYAIEDNHFNQNDNSQLEVRAVIVKCKIRDNTDTSVDSDIMRFQREELFKHNALKECKQKLTLTVKACSEPNHVSGDEYVPIDHVLGANKKRIRLLHPYVLRLQRELPFQVYKLQRIDTVRGIIAAPSEENWVSRNDSKRSQRDIHTSDLEDLSGPPGSASSFTLDHENKSSFSIKIRERNRSRNSISHMKLPSNGFNTCDHTNIWYYTNNSLLSKKSRLKRNIKDYEENLSNRWTSVEKGDKKLEKDERVYDEYEDFSQNNVHFQHKNIHPIQISDVKKSNSFSDFSFNSAKSGPKTETIEAKPKRNKKKIDFKLKDEERTFALYEIGDPDLWYKAQIQLFEKLSTPEGKTLWNDLTKEDVASVSNYNPEWSNQDLNVQYKPIDWLPRNEFTLTNSRLCLVVPVKIDSDNPVFDKYGKYMIVPIDDIITISDIKTINQRDDKPYNLSDALTKGEDEHPRRVVVRVTRALMGGSAESLKIISRGTDHYLKLPHTKPHHAQIDIEGRADENELVLVGALGRLTTIVSDTTRKSRSILTVQATNTGLAAAPFRVFIRECTPELSDADIERREKIIAGPELLPPRHTMTFRLSLPIHNAINSAHCVMSLLNQDDESIAIRDVRIKRDDRCFCIWHCDCVCLSEDPKLLCRGLTEAQMVAAGLTAMERSRHTRSICYPDVATINFFVTFIGVLLALLLLGICKAVIGLIVKCVGTCGLHLILQAPRHLDRYHECSIRCRPVVYDDEGWPVHPDSKERTVRVVSVPVEFVLNVIFFVTLPWLMIWEAIRKLALLFKTKETRGNSCCRKSDTKKCFSSHEGQVSRSLPRRRRALLRWMSPQAEELSTDLWTEGLAPDGTTTCDCPLLHQKTCCVHKDNDESLCSDSDQEDTEYVLMQMQKSSESLAKCQQNKDEKSKTQLNKNITNVNEKR